MIPQLFYSYQFICINNRVIVLQFSFVFCIACQFNILVFSCIFSLIYSCISHILSTLISFYDIGSSIQYHSHEQCDLVPSQQQIVVSPHHTRINFCYFLFFSIYFQFQTFIVSWGLIATAHQQQRLSNRHQIFQFYELRQTYYLVH